jgi:hypothetical protein
VQGRKVLRDRAGAQAVGRRGRLLVREVDGVTGEEYGDLVSFLGGCTRAMSSARAARVAFSGPVAE